MPKLFRWLFRDRRERQERVVTAAHDLMAEHGERARYEAILFATMTRDGKLFEPGRDAQFWWRVVLEIDKRTGHQMR